MKKTFLFSVALWASLGGYAQSTKAPVKTAGRVALEQALPAWLVTADGLQDISDLDAYGAARTLPGATPLAKAQQFINSQLREAGVLPDEWTMVRNVSTAKFTYVDFNRTVQGREVLFSHLRFQFTNDGRLVRLQIAVPEGPAVGAQPVLASGRVAEAAVYRPHEGEVIRNVAVDGNWVWFPERDAKGVNRLQPAYAFTADGISEDGQTPAVYEGYISAVSGKLLERFNRTRTDLNLRIQGRKQSLRPTDPVDTVGFPDLQVNVGTSSFYTNDTGFVSGTGITLPATVTLPLQGLWSKVNMINANGTTPSITATITAAGRTVIRTDNQTAQNAYYHVTRIHDFVKAQLPTFTGMDTQLPTNVDDPSNTCNAFYNGSSINFYAAGGGCNSMANYSDIIYHEYGHGVNERFYNQNGARRMSNGALNEGYADVWAMLLTKVPVIGQGATGGGSVIRRYDNSTKVIPTDIMGEVHADGEMIAGSWWDVARYLGDADSMRPIFVESFYSLADGLAGNEPAIYRRILVAALLADDNDANLNNGTPHFGSIIKAFANHGIYLGAYAAVTHTELDHQPSNQAIPITATITVAQPAVFGGATVFFRPRMTPAIGWDSVQLVAAGGTYSASIPAQPSGSILDYYIRVKNTLAPEDLTYYPQGFRPELPSVQVTMPYQFGVGLQVKQAQDFETDITGWQVGNVSGDNAQSGIWTWAAPIATYQTGTGFTALMIQPGANHTVGGSKCLLTSNTGDVDGGQTSVLSPVFDLTGMTTPILEYYRWFSNDRGLNARTDYWRVQLQSGVGGIPLPVDYTKQSDYTWRRRIFRVNEYLRGTTAQSVVLRFLISDIGGDNPLEGAIDDVVVYDAENPAATQTVVAMNTRIYPNPAGNLLTVAFEGKVAGATISLCDLQGRTLIEGQTAAGQREVSFNTANLVSGTYFVRIKADGVQSIKKVQVLH
ncbi:MAG: T9SS type A sorting domain-containing protein [Sphingobacteriales bacterium]|nr:MAG: T9SS type A sorting domain-containing protein [Sphingobacteriales bacterium]